jgi:ribosomal protein L35
MKKFKSRNSITKRFKLTKKGKLMHRSQNISHLIKQKSKNRRRRQAVPQELNTTFAKKLKQISLIK